MRATRSVPALFLLATSTLLGGCGQASSGGVSPAQATIDFIRKHGFPKLADLMPGLPAQLARVKGVATGDSGLPELPRAVAGADFGDATKLVYEAQGLAAQGFSESRRLEASLLNLVTPAYDLLGRADLFAAGENDASAGKASGLEGADFLADAAASGAVRSLFEDLASQTSYAVNIGGKNGLPEYLVLGVDAKTGGVKISGLWPQGGAGAAFATGFAAAVRLTDTDDFDLSITFAPGQLSGLISGWAGQKCADDVWQLALGALPSGDKSLAITARECASTRDAVSQLALGRTGAGGQWKLTGAFAQNFPGADPDSLRGFLGERQGFVLQAAAANDASKLAAAAAVLSESDFAAPTQDKIDQFGVGSLLARFFQVKYFDPKAKAAADASIFDPPYKNVAYWMCEAPVVAAAVQGESGNSKALCKGSSLDVESILGTLTSLKGQVNSVGIVPDSVGKDVDGVIDVLSVRNSLFVGGTGDIAYKKAPDADFDALDGARKNALPAAVGQTQWLGGAQALLPKVLESEVPNTAYKALSAGLGGFLKDKCQALAGDAQAKAGKSNTAASLCGG